MIYRYPFGEIQRIFRGGGFGFLLRNDKMIKRIQGDVLFIFKTDIRIQQRFRMRRREKTAVRDNAVFIG